MADKEPTQGGFCSDFRSILIEVLVSSRVMRSKTVTILQNIPPVLKAVNLIWAKDLDTSKSPWWESLVAGTVHDAFGMLSLT